MKWQLDHLDEMEMQKLSACNYVAYPAQGGAWTNNVTEGTLESYPPLRMTVKHLTLSSRKHKRSSVCLLKCINWSQFYLSLTNNKTEIQKNKL